jgi:hypothetical protein
MGCQHICLASHKHISDTGGGIRRDMALSMWL